MFGLRKRLSKTNNAFGIWKPCSKYDMPFYLLAENIVHFTRFIQRMTTTLIDDLKQISWNIRQKYSKQKIKTLPVFLLFTLNWFLKKNSNDVFPVFPLVTLHNFTMYQYRFDGLCSLFIPPENTRKPEVIWCSRRLSMFLYELNYNWGEKLSIIF